MTSAVGGRGLFVVFEGIDGSGKTTVSNRVATALTEAGVHVAHVRAGGVLASATAERIREFTRDPRNLALTPFAELLLYAAREAQQLDEQIRPRLADAEVVIADRFFSSVEVLARFGRGLDAAAVHAVLSAVTRGVRADLTLLVDVDPHVARARRRADKIARPRLRPSSRKGLGGAELMRRLREGFRALAAADPTTWVTIDNSDRPLEQVVTHACACVKARLAEHRRERSGGGAPAATSLSALAPARPDAPSWAPARPVPPRDAGEALAALLGWIDAATEREPEVAAYLLGGLAGPGIDERRWRLLPRAPRIVASGLRGLDDAASWRLREELAATEPDRVARSLVGPAGTSAAAWALRMRLARIAPAAVAASLTARGEPPAWALRDLLWGSVPDAVVASLAGDASTLAWAQRKAWLAAVGGLAAFANPELATAACTSVMGLADDDAWTWRLAARAAVPVAAITSLAGIDRPEAWAWREGDVIHAPRPVLQSITGINVVRAWNLRELMLDACKETIDSIAGLDGAAAWELRTRAADRYPSTVVKSLGPALATSRRGRELVARQLHHHPTDLSLLRHVVALTAAPTPVQAAVG
jgi:dTMP kinase